MQLKKKLMFKNNYVVRLHPNQGVGPGCHQTSEKTSGSSTRRARIEYGGATLVLKVKKKKTIQATMSNSFLYVDARVGQQRQDGRCGYSNTRAF